MLTTLPYDSFKIKPVLQIPSYTLFLFINMLIALNIFFSKEGNNQYMLKQYDVTVVCVTLNVLLFNSILSLHIRLPQYLLGEFYTL